MTGMRLHPPLWRRSGRCSGGSRLAPYRSSSPVDTAPVIDNSDTPALQW